MKHTSLFFWNFFGYRPTVQIGWRGWGRGDSFSTLNFKVPIAKNMMDVCFMPFLPPCKVVLIHVAAQWFNLSKRLQGNEGQSFLFLSGLHFFE